MVRSRLPLCLLVVAACSNDGGKASTDADTNATPDANPEAIDASGGSSVDTPLVAFPGAEGFGAVTVGGRGGRVIYVTNLDDSGEGSLRAACEAEGPRTVVFRVGGTITIGSNIEVDDPYLTIAGQTAPGDGILIRGNGARSLSLFDVTTHDVIFRHLRLRRGPSTNGGECTSDTIALVGADRIMVDHISASWTTDQLLTLWPATNVTLQHSIFAEALFNSTHSDDCTADGPLQAHALGPIIGSASKNVSVFRNLFADNIGRNPFFAPNDGGDFEVINNLVYNVCYAIGLAGRGDSELRANAIGNYIKWGPQSCDSHRNNVYMSGTTKAYLQDNLTPLRNAEDPEWQASSEFQVRTPADTSFQATTRFDLPIANTLSATEVYAQVPTTAGARLVANEDGSFGTSVDSVDQRVLDDVLSGTAREGTEGRRLDHPNDVGGWPTIADGTPYLDADLDGMADVWEDAHSLDKSDGSDGNGDPDGDGYTNLEEYLNQTLPK